MYILSAVLHVMYVNVITPATVVVVVLIKMFVHSAVVSMHSGMMDNGLLGMMICMFGLVMWVKENSVDMSNGSSDVGASVAVSCAVALVIVSEIAVFGCALWVVILLLVSGTANNTVTVGVLQHVTVDGTAMIVGTVFQNALTLANTDLLFMTGLLAVVVMNNHATLMLGSIQLWIGVIVLAGTVFLVVQCCEYQHLYWSMFSSGSAMMFFVVTGLHGAHVMVGVCLIGGYWLILHWYWCYSSADLSIVCGVLGVFLYWHFVDLVWVSVVILVYAAQLSL